MLRRVFRPSRLGVAVVAMISSASGVWTLRSDDLSSVIFGQSTIRLITCFVVGWFWVLSNGVFDKTGSVLYNHVPFCVMYIVFLISRLKFLSSFWVPPTFSYKQVIF